MNLKLLIQIHRFIHNILILWTKKFPQIIKLKILEEDQRQLTHKANLLTLPKTHQLKNNNNHKHLLFYLIIKTHQLYSHLKHSDLHKNRLFITKDPNPNSRVYLKTTLTMNTLQMNYLRVQSRNRLLKEITI